MKINFYTSLLYYAILFNTMNLMFNYYYLIFTAYLLWVFSVATNSPLLKNLCPHKSHQYLIIYLALQFLFHNSHYQYPFHRSSYMLTILILIILFLLTTRHIPVLPFLTN